MSALPLRYDPFDPDVLQDPYSVYVRLRRAGPLCRGGPGQWVATHYQDVVQLLMSNKLGSEFLPGQRAYSMGSGSTSSFYERILLNRDSPAHGRLRALLGQASGAVPRAALAQRLGTLVGEL